MYFIYSPNVKSNVMRFDAIEGKTNVKGAKIEQISDVTSVGGLIQSKEILVELAKRPLLTELVGQRLAPQPSLTK